MKRIFAVVAGLLAGMPALAQTKPPAPTAPAAAAQQKAPRAVENTPERTTASFGDWVLRCETVAEQAKRVCEVALVMTVQGQTNSVADVTFASASLRIIRASAKSRRSHGSLIVRGLWPGSLWF
jgi:invasion protein IalB